MSDTPTYYTAYQLPEAERARLLDIFPAKFDKIVMHHVTYDFDVTSDQKPPKVSKARIVGCHANDRIQALVVELDDQKYQKTAHEKRYLHITLSRDAAAGVRNVESNHMLEEIVKKSGETALYNLPEPIMFEPIPVNIQRRTKTPDSLKKPQNPRL